MFGMPVSFSCRYARNNVNPHASLRMPSARSHVDHSPSVILPSATPDTTPCMAARVGMRPISVPTWQCSSPTGHWCPPPGAQVPCDACANLPVNPAP